MKYNLKTLRGQFNKLQAANDKFGHKKAKHVTTILQHCDVCEGVLKLWIENEKERKVLVEQLEGFEKELREKIDWLLQHRTSPCSIPHISDPNLKDRRLLGYEDSAKYDLLKEILGENKQ